MKPFLRASGDLFSRARVRVLYLAGLMVLATLGLYGQDAKALSVRGTPIPKGPYKTWSLFLINNPDWLRPQSADKIESLYDQFEAFGEAIGPDHVAVWFWKSDVQTKKAHRAVDVDRAAVFCAKLNLPPIKPRPGNLWVTGRASASRFRKGSPELPAGGIEGLLLVL